MPEVSEFELARLMQGMTDQERMLFLTQYNSEKKDRTIALILSVVIGFWGVDRFYVGDILLGILKLLTGGCCLVWYVIDWFLIMGRVDEYNREKARQIAAAIRLLRGSPLPPGGNGPQQPSPAPSPQSGPSPYPTESPPSPPGPSPHPGATVSELPPNVFARLEAVQGPMAGQKFFLLKIVNLVGRSSDSDIQILDPSVSRHHFRLRFERGQFWIENLSGQGTFLNGQPVAQWQPIKDGDYIQAGRVVLQFRVQGTA
ncbi:MAG: FHA domain-containing protein [Armatimonadetes bacterium]|nr:FHA domain-containing protein [Armatimonadota bacterium]MDW8121040.1 FHA domain-containing protein [Armatimonadota bacterium]